MLNILNKLKTFRAPTLHADVPLSDEISHSRWRKTLLELCDKPGFEVLEVGSRAVVSAGMKKEFKYARHTGFDYYTGENVDVVGDAHHLSKYFDKKFDLIYSSAVFEHLAMPWKVAHEISKLLKVDGYIFVETHYSFSSHERPWHFFQFSEEALRILFSEAMGFQCVAAGASNPIFGFFSKYADRYLRWTKVPGLYCHSEYLGKKIKEVDFSWDSVTPEELLPHHYPEPRK